MKLYICVVLALAITVRAWTDEQKKRLDDLNKECLDVSKVDPETLKEAEKGNFVDDPKLKLQALCFSKKIQLQDDKGELHPDKIRERLNSQMQDKQEIEKLLNLCLIKKATPEDSAFESLHCFYKNSPKDVVVF